MKKITDIFKRAFSWFMGLAVWKKVLIIAVIAVILYFAFGRGGDKMYYNTSPVTRGNIKDVVEASGTISPVAKTDVGTQVSGTISRLYVDYNSVVKKGDMLAELDPALLEAAVTQQQAALMKSESTLRNDERTYDRYKKLYKQDFVAKSELDSAETQYLSSKASYIQAKASLDKAQTDLSYSKIISPVDGIVISRAVDEGQTVAASFQTPTLFVVAQDLTKMQIEVKVSEADIIKVKEGQAVVFSIDGYPQEEFKGEVRQVRLEAETVQGMVAYTVVISVDNHDLKLKPGMTANVTIITEEKKDVLLVPNAALRYVPKSVTQRFQSRGVWVVYNGAPERVEIKLGIMDDKNTEVLDSDLEEGEPVIISETANKKQASSLLGGPPSRSSRNAERKAQQQIR
ncbi:HlyD family secretion protein [Parelusimicrobium proximum]|uniref:efflux RND transporter periplasmic adaptor subunit n=1 Tax=Parelusimicrobium proximum TaxID=3228953 RepID=UPI003D16A8C6